MSGSNTPGPYPAGSPANSIYQLLFCDDPSLFAPHAGIEPAPWQQLLFSPNPDPAAVRALAEDPQSEGRIRMLAANLLIRNGQPLGRKELLGAIIEVGLDGGLDTLAVYSDSGIRYINQTGKIAIFETAPGNMRDQVGRVLTAAGTIVSKIGPWDKPRLPAPGKDMVRLTFLVTDGLYFGQGPFAALQRDAMAGPLIAEFGRLLQLVVATAGNR